MQLSGLRPAGEGGAVVYVSSASMAAVARLVTRHGDAGAIHGDDAPAEAGGKRARKRRRKTRREVMKAARRAGVEVVEGEGDGDVEGAESRDVRHSNAAVFLTMWPRPGADGGMTRGMAAGLTVATRDDSDQAHSVRAPGDQLLVNAADLVSSGRKDVGGGSVTPRRYPASQMTSRGVAFDSSFDEMGERIAWLRENGFNAADGVSAGLYGSVSGMMGEQIRAAAREAKRRGQRLCDVVRVRVMDESSMGDSEEAVEAYALAQIAAHRAGVYKPADADGGAE